MAQVPIDEVHALATWLSSIFLGALIVLYFACVWVLAYKPSRMGPINMPMLLAATAMVVISIIHNAVSVQRNVQAFFDHVDGNPVKYFILSSNFPNLFQTALFVAQVLIGDAMLPTHFQIYRCSIVYNRDWRVIIIPILMLLGTFACGIELIYQFSLVDARTVTDETYFGHVVQPWSTGMKVVSMAQNVICSGAIAFRIWWIGRHNSGRIYWRSIELILESGIVYFLVVLILLILNVMKQNAYSIVYYAMVPIIGIIFTGIIIRAGLREGSTVDYDSTSLQFESSPKLQITFTHPTPSEINVCQGNRSPKLIRKEISMSSQGSSSFTERSEKTDSENGITVETRDMKDDGVLSGPVG
ncbi:hypothetical protein NEOLEDRAFT_1184467 [Neolentinus lepideus HHB14362 ss-1]|uniref:Uncharacterized protein n=1 Tax=Neolentinus lepideus HHB14362 ss-1 TaxID=1314782 RepID=A0A165MDW5_9AGAM|nr:hypothetical protein NEOLEDRAFT_1184467 [Neolentinus lepideus HHB14362 ss-1]